MATITQLVDAKDANNSPMFIPPFSNYVLAKSLAAGVAEDFTVPANGSYVIFSANVDFYANDRAAAAVPGDVVNGSASELNPTARACVPGSTISVIAPIAGIVTAAFYSKTP